MADNYENLATPELLNAVRNDASDAYRAAVPFATRGNLQDVGNPIMNYKPAQNEFMDILVNKIIFTLVDRRTWNNPLGILKSGDEPLGTDIEDVHLNPAQAVDYDGSETGMADILKEYKPDAASVYYRMNRQDKYRVTINNQQLRRAFTSWNALENLIAAIVDTLYTGNTIDEFKYTKLIATSAIAAGRIQTVSVPNVNSEANGKLFMTQLRTLSTLFTFPSDKYNNYILSGGTGNPRISWCPINEQIILVRADVASAVGVEVMATVFNMDYANYLARQIIVDDFGATNTLAIIADRRAFVIYQQLREFATFFNASTIGWNYFYHAWDLFAMSPFKNCVALVEAAP